MRFSLRACNLYRMYAPELIENALRVEHVLSKTGGRFRLFRGKYGCACPPAKAVRDKANAAQPETVVD
ncbi:hypothetical protein JDN40_03695 [Rhodomicrobium vannielii ATCC 17100]|uniref:hypothetical protein n=1 Tax=Rhodomicrobium vannielii TaxID=1069 RepID=UPI001918B37A|nr:hypothetical protein [Rhodomicrobium vannielii]MBJ7533210.1 hypothetical protein [Rhodomicrobium vannielii ATCC 17100]